MQSSLMAEYAFEAVYKEKVRAARNRVFCGPAKETRFLTAGERENCLSDTLLLLGVLRRCRLFPQLLNDDLHS